MTRLTTHVLDTAQGIPAERMAITLLRIDGDGHVVLFEGRTNADGRLDTALVEGDDFVPGTYELVFDVGGYFHHQPLDTSDPPFLDVVTIRFAVADASDHYHVPLLVSPWAYSTYRGS